MAATARTGDTRQQFLQDVREGLTQSPKRLPSRYLYDSLGSRLFEAICELPTYSITRAETALLRRYGGEILATLPPQTTIVELGSGSGEKLAMLTEALRGRTRGERVSVHVVDISRTAIEQSQRTLDDSPHLAVTPHVATYEQGLRAVASERDPKTPLLVVFLGSNIGNFTPSEAASFLEGVRSSLRPGDALLLGADLLKPEADLLLAYDDPIGVTAAFNKNILGRINRELAGDFDLRQFEHRAVINRGASRIEMHLVSAREQTVTIAAADLSVRFAEGESIWTESCSKYTPESLIALGQATRFHCEKQWIEPSSRFCETLFVASAA